MNAPRASNPSAESNTMRYVQLEGGSMTGKAMDMEGECNLCGTVALSEFVDGATRMGPWANMCLPCFKRVGKGLGVGRGQRYAIITDVSGSMSIRTQAALAHAKAKADWSA